MTFKTKEFWWWWARVGVAIAALMVFIAWVLFFRRG